MGWLDKIDADIAILDEYGFKRLAHRYKSARDVAVAAEQHVAEWDDADATLQEALDKLRGIGDD